MAAKHTKKIDYREMSSKATTKKIKFLLYLAFVGCLSCQSFFSLQRTWVSESILKFKIFVVDDEAFYQERERLAPTDVDDVATFEEKEQLIASVDEILEMKKKDTTNPVVSAGSSPPSPFPYYSSNNNNNNNMKKGGRRTVTTIQGRQGFHLPLDLLEWNLPVPPSQASTSRRRNFTKTICATHSKLEQAKTTKDMFTGVPDWELIQEKTDDPACSNSRVRLLYEGFKKTQPEEMPTFRDMIRQHEAGSQLTSTIIGNHLYKDDLLKLIQNQTTTTKNEDDNNNIKKKEDQDRAVVFNLQDTLPTTRAFDSTTSCENFCDGEWLQSQLQQQREEKQQPPQKWIWKPTKKNQGKGIVLVGDETTDKDGVVLSSLESCHRHCKEEGGESLVAQKVADAMTLPDGRKFDLRSYILVANVDPLVVFTGGGTTRICVEPMNATNPKQFPGISANSSWNPFQQVCNKGILKKHPSWSAANNTGPLEKGIHDDAVRSRVLSNIDQIDYALVELLYQRWEGEVGMFQLLAADYVVDNSEKVWLLELNNNPGFIKNGPNPWGDIFEIEWTILETYNNNQQHRYTDADDDDGRSGGGVGSSDDDGTTHHNPASTWKRTLQKRLSELELETLRMMPPLWSS